MVEATLGSPAGLRNEEGDVGMFDIPASSGWRRSWYSICSR